MAPFGPAGWTAFQNVSVRRWRLNWTGFYRDTCPVAYVGRGINAPNKLRNKAASGQLAVNASFIRLAVSLIRTAIFSNRSRMVENSPLANGCGWGIAPRTVSMSQ